jgi:hypothetical protein
VFNKLEIAMSAIKNAIDFDAVAKSGTARKIQKDYLAPRVNNHLPVLRGVEVVASARNGVIEVTFTPPEGSLFDKEHRRIIRDFMTKEDFLCCLVPLLEGRHGWSDFKVEPLPSQQGLENYIWSIQRRDKLPEKGNEEAA